MTGLSGPAQSEAARIAHQLMDLGTPERAKKEKQYLKSDLEHIGASMPNIRSVVKPVARGFPDDGHDSLMALGKQLWDSQIHELRMSAALLLVYRTDLIGAPDLPQIEDWLRESRTWALVDTLTPYPVAAISEREPIASEPVLDTWAEDDDFWMRRAALLAHLVPLREGHGDWIRFTRYADHMLEDTQFFVRKAIGWVLRDTARRRPELVSEWLAPRTAIVSGVTIREAVKPLEPDDRERLLLAYREGKRSK